MEMGSIYKGINALKERDADVYLTKRNKIVVSFLNGLAQESVKYLSIRKAFAVEHIYQMNSKNLIAPISFVQTSLQYQASQSRYCVDLSSKLSPSGSYKSLTKWL